MEIKQSLLLVVTLIVVAGCKEPPTSAKATVDDYFPLHDGDKWIYRYGSDSAHITERDTVLVSGTITIDSVNYFRYFLHQLGRTDTTYLRKDSTGKVFVRNPLFDKEGLYLDFSRSIGEYSFPLDSVLAELVLRTGDTVVAPAGIFSKTFVIAVSTRGHGGSGPFYTYAASVGLIKENQDYFLESATVGNTDYP